MQQTNITTGLTAAEVAQAPKNIPAHHASAVARGHIPRMFRRSQS